MLVEFPTGLDCETTGADIWHGCKPFLICTYDPLEANFDEDHSDIWDQPYWEWDVDPMTREPIIPATELQHFRQYVEDRDRRIVYHNRKFEQRACQSIGVTLPRWEDEDTLTASHVVRSRGSHKLKDLAMEYCDVINNDQLELRDDVNDCRRYARTLGWRIAKEGDPHFPAVKPKKKGEGWWVYDMWLPRAVAKHRNLPPDHHYWTVCRKYCGLDAKRTALLWLVYYEAILGEGLVEQYLERRNLLEATYFMEKRGIPLSYQKVADAKLKYGLITEQNEARCYQLAKGSLENVRSPKQLQKVLYEDLGLEKRKATKSGWSTDKRQIEEFLNEARPNSRQQIFLRSLLRARKFATSLRYLESYEKFACPLEQGHLDGIEASDYDRLGYGGSDRNYADEFFILRPSINTTGTDTTRASSSDPNEQNVSKQEESNLREVYVPLPGREFYSMDYSNIEMRIFAYESGDRRLIEAFESGYKVHLIICEILHPELWAKCQREGTDFSQVYESTWYQWVKNGNFGLIYGAGERKTDLTYHVPGAYQKIKKEFPLIAQLMEAKDAEAKRYGYVTCLGGYRLYVPRNRPHVAVNYFIQGSAGWYLILAMNRIHRYLQEMPDYHMIMTVHDELDFDFPIQTDFRIVRDVADIMEQSGKDLGIEVPVSVERHSESWADGLKLDKAFPNWRKDPDTALHLPA